MIEKSAAVICAILGHEFKTVVSSLVPYRPGALTDTVGRAVDKSEDAEAFRKYKWVACIRCGARDDSLAVGSQ